MVPIILALPLPPMALSGPIERCLQVRLRPALEPYLHPNPAPFFSPSSSFSLPSLPNHINIIPSPVRYPCLDLPYIHYPTYRSRIPICSWPPLLSRLLERLSGNRGPLDHFSGSRKQILVPISTLSSPLPRRSSLLYPVGLEIAPHHSFQSNL